MILLSTIINKFHELFLAKYKDVVLPQHRKALQLDDAVFLS
jgi:hypothetical protein